jgi:hypothetical protein
MIKFEIKCQKSFKGDKRWLIVIFLWLVDPKEDYFKWITQTAKINAPFVFFTQVRFKLNLGIVSQK